MSTRNRTVYGIGLEAGDVFTNGDYILNTETMYDGETRFAVIKRGIGGEYRIRIDINQSYKMPPNFHAPYSRYVMGVITHVKTIGHTFYGNPIKIVELRRNDGTYQTYRISDNSSLVYAIANPEFNNVHYFELTKAGRISGRNEAY